MIVDATFLYNAVQWSCPNERDVMQEASVHVPLVKVEIDGLEFDGGGGRNFVISEKGPFVVDHIEKSVRKEISFILSRSELKSLPSKVLPSLFIGDGTHCLDFEGLEVLGVDFVLNLSGRSVNSLTELVNSGSADVSDHSKVQTVVKKRKGDTISIYHKIFSDEKLTNVPFDECIDIIESNIAKGKKVLVCCRAGRSRSGAVVMAFFMKNMRISYAEALRFVQSRRPLVHVNSGFVKQLKEIEPKVKKVSFFARDQGDIYRFFKRYRIHEKIEFASESCEMFMKICRYRAFLGDASSPIPILDSIEEAQVFVEMIECLSTYREGANLFAMKVVRMCSLNSHFTWMVSSLVSSLLEWVISLYRNYIEKYSVVCLEYSILLFQTIGNILFTKPPTETEKKRVRGMIETLIVSSNDSIQEYVEMIKELVT